MPIEKSYVETINSVKEELDGNEFKKLNYYDHIATCWNIHKSLKPYILSKLKQQGLNEKFIYPDNGDLKKYTLLSALEEI